jgi:hypothetical protein
MFLCIQLDLRLGVKDLFMHKKHSLRALNIKTILRKWQFLFQKFNVIFFCILFKTEGLF